MACSLNKPGLFPKSIYFVGNTAWSMYNFRLGVLKALCGDNFRVTVLAPRDDWSVKLEQEGIPYIPVMMDNRGTSPLKDLKLLWRLYRLYKKASPDLIIHYTIKPNIYGSVAAAICGIKSIAFVTGAGSVFVRDGLLTNVVKKMFRFSFRFPDQVWFLNRDDASLFISCKLVRDSKCKILPGEGVDTENFSDSYSGEDKDTFIFLFLGRLLWDKGIGEYVKAARAVKQKHTSAVFKILGFLDVQNPSAVSRLQLEEWMDEDVIEYLGSTDNVKQYISNADCVVLPSYREGIPRSLLEASSMGKPVIATDVPGCRDAVDDAITGYICRPGDYTDLAKKMEMMMTIGQSRRHEMGKAGRKKVQEAYGMNIIIRLYKEALESI